MRERYFKFARTAAKFSDYRGTRSAPAIGAVAVYKGSIVAEACNTNKTSPLQAHYNIYRYEPADTPCKAHCETQLIQRIRWKFGNNLDWSKVHIYLYREYKDGSLAPSRPCPSCMAMLRDFGIKKIMYTTEDGFAEEKIK